MKELKGTQTERNLKAAFQGESMARNKYTFFEIQARDEGHEDIARLFARMAKNEMTHAKIWYEAVMGIIGDTDANIKTAVSGENDEWSSMYPRFAQVARDEGFEELAEMFENVARIEKNHELEFLKAYAALRGSSSGKSKTDAVEKTAQRPRQQGYRCMFCGAVYEKRPDVCSTCKAIGSFEAITE